MLNLLSLLLLNICLRCFKAELLRFIATGKHLYPKGNHGFVLSLPTDEWMQPLFDWMRESGFVTW
tara:strand:+ start:114 stop:308 length:195 start_codon:yes stop_codon:yes gene_type:complete